MRKPLIAMALLVLAGCAFGSEGPLFDERDGVALFGDGQAMRLDEGPDGGAELFEFERDGHGYLMAPRGESARMRIFFAPIEATPEEDYVAQVRLNPDGQGVAYAFVWRYGDRLRAIAAPSGVGENEPDPRFCRVLNMRECQFDNREDVLGYYRERIYPRFVIGDEAPSSYIDITPESAVRPDK